MKLTTHVHAVSSLSIKEFNLQSPILLHGLHKEYFFIPWRNWLLHQIRFLPAQKACMNFNCIMLKLVIDDSFTFKLFWPLIVNWQNRFSLSLRDESAGCGFLYFLPLRKLPKHFDELYPLSATPFVFLSLCVREHVNSNLIDWKHASLTHPSHTPHPPPCTHHHKQTAMHTNKHVKFVERQAQNCIFSFLTRLRVRWARNKCDADRQLSQCLFALCAGQSYVYLYRGMGRQFDVCTIYLKSIVVKGCWIFNSQVLRFSFVATISTDNPLTDWLTDVRALEGQYELTVPLTMQVMDMKYS